MECNHKRGFNLETKSYVCENCGVDWDSMKTKKTLYCATFMVKTATGWRADMVYMHHDSLQEARLQFYRSEQRVVRQIHIAEAIGFLACDDNADQVVA